MMKGLASKRKWTARSAMTVLGILAPISKRIVPAAGEKLSESTAADVRQLCSTPPQLLPSSSVLHWPRIAMLAPCGPSVHHNNATLPIHVNIHAGCPSGRSSAETGYL